MKTYQNFSTLVTPQSEAIPGSNQVGNNAGGFVWSISDWYRLERFLILGSEGGTYYVKEHKLTSDNAKCVLRCLDLDAKRTIDKITEISTEGRAPKNDPCLFALAMAASIGDEKNYALAQLPKVARIGTHLFHFLEFVQQFRGWGRLLRTAVANWYNDKDVDALAYQCIKYRQRDGWSHRDALRKSHPIPPNSTYQSLYHWITQGKLTPTAPAIVRAYEDAQICESEILYNMIRAYNLPREAIPTEMLNNKNIWDALLEKMPLTAMIRNLGKMTSVGTIGPMSANLIVQRLTDKDQLKKARVHPLSILVALNTYTKGHGFKGSLSWSPNTSIIDALDQAFYLSFDTVKPTCKRTMLALDVSSSMSHTDLAGMTGISPRIGTAAMALITASVEPNYVITAFTSRLTTLNISPRQRLDDVVKTVKGLPFGRTDCSLPMIYALEHNISVDTFVIYTDNETWCGGIHPVQALLKYRKKTGIYAKLIVVSMEPTEFSIADPSDPGMLDVVGFDTATPNVISEFSK